MSGGWLISTTFWAGARSASPEPEPTRPLRKRLRDDLVYAGVRGLMAAAGMLPRTLLRPLAAFLGWILTPFLTRHRGPALRNLALAYPGLGERERRGILSRALGSLLLSALEIMRVRAGRDPLEFLDGVEGLEAVHRARSQGRGVVHVTAHLGNWELLVLVYARLGFSPHAIRQNLKDPRFDALLDQLHEKQGIGLIRRGASALGAFRVLARGGVLGILADMDTDVESVEVPFFGHPVRAPLGPVVLARRSGAALIPAFLTRNRRGGHELKVGEEIRLEGLSDAQGAAAYTRALEDEIRLHPGQWSWFNKRFPEGAR